MKLNDIVRFKNGVSLEVGRVIGTLEDVGTMKKLLIEPWFERFPGVWRHWESRRVDPVVMFDDDVELVSSS